MISSFFTYIQDSYHQMRGTWTPKRLNNLSDYQKYDMAKHTLFVTPGQENSDFNKEYGYTKENLDYLLDHNLVDPSLRNNDLLEMAHSANYRYYIDKMIKHPKIDICNNEVLKGRILSTCEWNGWDDIKTFISAKCREDIPQ